MAKKRRWKEYVWRRETNPDVLIRLLGNLATPRKLQLFGVACCKRIQHLLTDPRSLSALDAAEQFADRLIDEDRRWKATSEASRVLDELAAETGPDDEPDDYEPNPGTPQYYAAEAAYHVTLERGGASPLRALQAVCRADTSPDRRQWSLEAHTQCDLLRDIFGNPFRSVSFDPAWRTSTTLALARQMYDSRDFSPMPILADALQDAGCEHADILDHCRNPGPHVRGCWVVDLVLEKS